MATTSASSVDNYTANRLDRTRNGGGVITYVNNSFSSKPLENYQNDFNKLELEITVTEVTLNTLQKTIILGVYRPPNSPSSWFDNFNKLIMTVTTQGPIIIMGDLNCDILQPNIHSTKLLMTSLVLASTVIPRAEPTRIGTHSATCLDIIAISEDFECRKYGTGSLSASDHLPVAATIMVVLSKNKPKPIVKRSFKNTNMRNLSDAVREIKLIDTNTHTVDEILDTWQHSFNNVLDEFAPVKAYPMRRHRCKWMNDQVRDLIRERDHKAVSLKKNPSNKDLKSAHKKLQRRVKSNLRRSAKDYGKQMLEDNNSRQAWKYIREVTLTTKKEKTAFINHNTLNDFFADLVRSRSGTDLLAIDSCDSEESFNFKPLTEFAVNTALQTVNTTTAPGEDGITGTLIKSLSAALTCNLTKIMNLSLENGQFPKKWERANVTAIWKGKGSKTDPSNYRPISVLPIFARLLEKMCARQLSHFVEERGLIPDQQFGFRARSSCEHALIAGLDSWMASMDKGEVVGALLVDLSKAFDSVPHNMLLAELNSVGCSQMVLKWFHSYLSRREQRIVTQESITPWKTVSRGVPQGSCLSPLLFNIFIRELPSNCTSLTFQFADDVTHSEADRSPEVVASKLSISYSKTKAFCDARDLSINAAKSQVIIFKQANKRLPDNFQISLGDCNLQPSNTVKLLGVTLDKHLTFKDHVDSTVQKCHGLLGVLARSAPFLTTELLKISYSALIRSQLEYCSSIFASAAPSHLKKLDVIQKMASRIICRAPRNSHSEPLLERLQLDSLSKRRITHIVSIVDQILKGESHPGVSNMFHLTDEGRADNDSICRLQVGNRRFSVFAKMLYNSSN